MSIFLLYQSYMFQPLSWTITAPEPSMKGMYANMPVVSWEGQWCLCFVLDRSVVCEVWSCFLRYFFTVFQRVHLITFLFEKEEFSTFIWGYFKVLFKGFCEMMISILDSQAKYLCSYISWNTWSGRYFLTNLVYWCFEFVHCFIVITRNINENTSWLNYCLGKEKSNYY